MIFMLARTLFKPPWLLSSSVHIHLVLLLYVIYYDVLIAQTNKQTNWDCAPSSRLYCESVSIAFAASCPMTTKYKPTATVEPWYCGETIGKVSRQTVDKNNWLWWNCFINDKKADHTATLSSILVGVVKFIIINIVSCMGDVNGGRCKCQRADVWKLLYAFIDR